MSAKFESNADDVPDRRPVIFVQPFGASDLGGGARILRALLESPPVRCVSVVAAMRPPKPTSVVEQHYVPLRPLGRLNRTRLRLLIRRFDPIWRKWHQRTLQRMCVRLRPKMIHLIVQPGCDFASLVTIARNCRVPLAASFHDHPSFYTGQGNFTARDLVVAREIWLNAVCRFVVSPELGNKLCQDFGDRTFDLVTDGVNRFQSAKDISSSFECSIYFMGLLHKFYEPNFRSLLQALERVGQETAKRFTLQIRSNRCPSFPAYSHVRVEYLPFADDVTVADDIERADILFLPLPFGEAGRSFTDYSLSTKMISYLASGRPILYHGPAAAASGRLLERSGAAICVMAPDSDALAVALRPIVENGAVVQRIVTSALRLAQTQFDILRIRARFWGKMLAMDAMDACIDSGRSNAAESQFRSPCAAGTMPNGRD